MLDVSMFDQISDVDEVEKVVYLTRTSRDGSRENRFRVEAVRHQNGKYSTVVYRQLEVIVSVSEIADGKQLNPQLETIWVCESAPWTDRDSADEAIGQLLSLW